MIAAVPTTIIKNNTKGKLIKSITANIKFTIALNIFSPFHKLNLESGVSSSLSIIILPVPAVDLWFRVRLQTL